MYPDLARLGYSVILIIYLSLLSKLKCFLYYANDVQRKKAVGEKHIFSQPWLQYYAILTLQLL